MASIMNNAQGMQERRGLPLLAVNHISRVCADLEASFRFYSEVLGFAPVKRPSSFEFEGAWLFNYGMGLHLIKGCPPPRPREINPKACHLSFQAASLEAVEHSLIQMAVPFVKNVFMEDGIQIGQLFFHDPDNNMIEVCNCDLLPVVPLTEAILACTRPVVTPAAGTVASDMRSDASFDTSSCDEPVACAGSPSNGAGPFAASDVSFSHSSMSALLPGRDTDACNMSFTASELDEWPSLACVPCAAAAASAVALPGLHQHAMEQA